MEIRCRANRPANEKNSDTETDDSELEASYPKKPDNSKYADNIDFPDVGKMVENQQEEQKYPKTVQAPSLRLACRIIKIFVIW